MLKLSEPADLREESNIRTICLPFIAFGYPQSMNEELYDQKDDDTDAIPIRDNNFLRNIRIKKLQSMSNHSTRLNRQPRRSHTRRNDKFLHGNLYAGDTQSGKTLQVWCLHYTHRLFRRDTIIFQDLPYTDCIATGWGRSATSGDLTDILLQTKVPIHTNVKYVENNLIAILHSPMYIAFIKDTILSWFFRFPFVFLCAHTELEIY